jgi:predicted  nucleic acid-binding Zn-ribbon protein
MESQSRYGIIQKLTKEKLDIMDKKNDLSTDISDKEQKLSDIESDYEYWKKTKFNDFEKEEQEFKKLIDKYTKEVQIAKDNKDKQEAHLMSKIEEIDKALVAIQEISKSAPTPQEQV